VTLLGPPDTGTSPTTRGEDLVTVLLGVWVILGLSLDGYAHQNLVDLETEDFFTPWHGVLYAGLLATAAWIGRLLTARATPGTAWYRWAPPGYHLAVPGLVAVFAGGVADLIWHTRFGIETSIDALLSPPHLVLVGGGLAVILSPYRAAPAQRTAVADPHPLDPAAGWRRHGVAVGSVTVATTAVAFFLVPLWGVNAGWWPAERYVPQSEQGIDAVIAGLGSQLVATVVLLGAVLALLRVGPLPLGAATVVFGVVNVASTLTFGRDTLGIVAGLAGGVTCDALLRVRPGGAATTDRQVRLALAATPTALWSTFYLLVAVSDRGLRWPVEIWSGAIVLCATAGFAFAWLATTPRHADSG
jgi:hypothetical protein